MLASQCKSVAVIIKHKAQTTVYSLEGARYLDNAIVWLIQRKAVSLQKC